MEPLNSIYGNFWKTTCDNELAILQATADVHVEKILSYSGFWGCYDIGDKTSLKYDSTAQKMKYVTERDVLITRYGPDRFTEINEYWGWNSASPFSPRKGNMCDGTKTQRVETLCWQKKMRRNPCFTRNRKFGNGCNG